MCPRIVRSTLSCLSLLLLLVLTCGLLRAAPALPFYAAPIPLLAKQTINYGNLYLYVDAASANNTNYVDNDALASLKDWGTNQWALTVANFGGRVITGQGFMTNNAPCILQTNSASAVGINGGFRLPSGWMASSAGTNFTITWVALAKAPEPQYWVMSNDGSVNGYLAQTVGTTRLESWDHGGNIDVTSANSVIHTNNWVIYTLVHGDAGNFVFYTNNLQAFSGGPGNSQAIKANGSVTANFFGVQYSGHANWTGVWKRVMMWDYSLSGADRTNYYNQIKGELGLLNLP